VSAQITQVINIDDNTAPAVTGTIAPVTVEGCDATAAAAPVTTVTALEALLGITIDDACTPDASLVVTSTDATNGTCPLVITRTYTIKDLCGNSVTVTQTINVNDTKAPVLNCPPSQAFCVDAGGNYQIPVISATDNCSSNLNFSYQISGATTRDGTGTDASGLFNVGISTITWTVTDACGNPATCTTTVTINPLPTPVISGPAPVCESINDKTETYTTPYVVGHTYEWTITGPGTIISTSAQGNEIVVKWTGPGKGTITVVETITETGCKATNTYEVTINPKPTTSPITHN
jgi:hypothetical protein